MRRRQEKHIRWVHLSLTALDASISSERQVTHSTLYDKHVSRDKVNRVKPRHTVVLPSAF